MKEKILIVAAHPDDEVLGCGGTIARFAKECAVYVLILGEGVTSRFDKRAKGLRSRHLKKIKASINKAAGLLGVRKAFAFNLPDNRFDTVGLLDIIKIIEKIKDQIRPDIVYTHSRADLNIDHRITYDAVLTACRPKEGESVKEVYSFEIPSSTEWNYPRTFSPNVFMDVSNTLDRKLRALECYETELRKFPHPRSEEAIKSIAKRWGSLSGLGYAEAFEAVRMIR